MKDKKIFIFDFDKTICTLEADWDIWREQRKEIVKKYDPDFSDTYLNHATQNERFKKYGEGFKKDAGEQARKFEMSIAICRPIHSVIELIKSLEGKKLYIWSSNSKEVVEKYLREFGIFEKFERIISFVDVEYLKPNPDGFKYIEAENPDMNLSEVIFIGDSDADKGVAEVIGIDYLDVQDI